MVENHHLNIVVLGEMGVGKSSLLVRYAERRYNPHLPATFNVDVLQSKIRINNEIWNLILWDTAGQEQFRAIVRNYFRKADGVLLVYDVTSLRTFIELPRWLSDLRKDNETAPVIIVGNKIDKQNIEEKVSVEQVKKFAERNKLDFMESSAKSGENVNKIFEKLTRQILLSKALFGSSENARNVNGAGHSSKSTLKENDSKITLQEINPSQKPKKTCC